MASIQMEGEIELLKLEKDQIREWLPSREGDQDTTKRDYGQVLLIGGAQGMGGSILMSAEAAVLSGAGLTTVATDMQHVTALHTRLPEAMATSLDDLNTLEDHIRKSTVVAIGPGLGLDQHAKNIFSLVLDVVNEQQILILDADALTLLSEGKQKPLPSQTILTPHAGEWQRLTGLQPSEQTDTENNKWAKKFKANVVLKGDQTRIYTAEQIYLNIKGSPAMATGGTGDCLTGCIAGICAQSKDVEKGMLAAVYIHSYIGVALSEESHVVRPTEIAQAVPRYIKQLSHYSTGN